MTGQLPVFPQKTHAISIITREKQGVSEEKQPFPKKNGTQAENNSGYFQNTDNISYGNCNFFRKEPIMSQNESNFFKGYIGQKRCVSILRAHIEGAIQHNQPMVHLGLAGPSGYGKSQLSECLARALGTNFLPFWATPTSKRWQLAKHIAQVKQHDFVMIDEAHNLGGVGGAAEVLYKCTDPEHPQVPLVEENRIVENSWVDLPKFTLILCSDNLGLLPKAAIERLCLRLVLERYSEDEMRQIVGHYASTMNLLLSPQSQRLLGNAAKGSPRRVRMLLQSLQVCSDKTDEQISKVAVKRHLEQLGFDDDLLQQPERNYLGVLGRRGGFVALETLALQIGVDPVTLRRDIEPFLIHKELISVESRGRTLSAKGVDYVHSRRLAI